MFVKYILLLIVFGTVSFAQLKDFTIIAAPPPSEFPPIMRSHPDDAAVIIFSSISGLQFESNNNQINDIKEEDGKYTIFLKPEKSLIKVKRKDFIEQNLPTLSLSAKEVKYYKIESKQDQGSSVIPINILTEPPGAKIFIDGLFKGVDINNKVQIGVHKVKLELEGYSAKEQSIEVKPESNFFRFQLERVDQVGIQIRSVPDKAQIFINNSFIGETDKTLFKYAGAYSIKLVKLGYLDLDSAIIVSDDKNNSFSFVLIKNACTLTINTLPENSEVRIDNNLAKKGDNELIPGSHLINVSKEGYLPENDNVSLHLGEKLVKTYTLLKNVGQISINTNPPDAKILINKEDYSGKTNIEIPAGINKIQIMKDDYYDTTEVIDIKIGEQVKKNYQLRQKKGNLQFIITPLDASAELYREGKLIDKWQGMKKIKDLQSGRYELHCIYPDYESISKTIIIPEDNTLYTEITMGKSELRHATPSGSGSPCLGLPTVTYSGKTYHTVQIGSQCWLRENLDVGVPITSNIDQSDNSIIEKFCYNDDENNCNKYGGLYQWNEAMMYNSKSRAQGICPNGWHIPTNSEFQILLTNENGNGNGLKEVGQGRGKGLGTNASGFSALFSGYRSYDGQEKA